MTNSIDWIRQACSDYVRFLPPSAQQPTAAAADFHLKAIAKELNEILEIRERFQRLQQEMESIGASAPQGD